MDTDEDLSLRLAQGLRQWQRDNPVQSIALGFVPVVGQAYGAASMAAAYRDPEATTGERALETASMVPWFSLIKGLRNRNNIFTNRGDQEEKLAAMRDLRRGADPGEVYADTGWWRSADRNRLLREIDDSKAIIDDGLYEARNLNWMDGGRVGDYIDHPELFRQYPDFKSIPVHLDEGAGSFFRGSSSRPTQDWSINIDPSNVSPERFPRVLTHELQHAVQEADRRGAAFRGADWSQMDFAKYLRNPGEMEARIVEQRQLWRPENRRIFSPQSHTMWEQMRLQRAPTEAYPSNQQYEDLINAVRRLSGE